MKLFIDIETYCDLDIKKVGAYKYVNHPSFEILLIGCALDDSKVFIFEGASMLDLFTHFLESLEDLFETWAHNAVFERLAFGKYNKQLPNLNCSAIKAAYCGLPLGLGDLSKALKLEEKGKLKTGNALIKYFCTPCAPTKTNGGRTRNLPHHDPEKWQQFKDYLVNDVVSMREAVNILECYELPEQEKKLYWLDQKINDRGVQIDKDLAKGAVKLNEINEKRIKDRMVEISGVQNPNSPTQLKIWLSEQTGQQVESLAKEVLPDLIENAGGAVRELLQLRSKLSKTSIKKYGVMLASEDGGRCRGTMQFYGANRTGRWAGRLVQVHNLPRNKLGILNEARQLVRDQDLDTLDMLFDDTASVLSQLVRTALVAKEGNTFLVADFSAIEARVTAWLANEHWRLGVFNGDGKIYEASAAMMFNLPIEQIDGELRQKGKIAELALGFGGSVGALMQMGAEKMGLSDEEMQIIVNKWRKASPNIVKLWRSLENAAIAALKNKGLPIAANSEISYLYDGTALRVQLPSGRELFYWKPEFTINRFGKQSIKYRGNDGAHWGFVDTYGGKLTENVVQAIARDLLAESMLLLDKYKANIIMHVHDEVVIETKKDELNDRALSEICRLMSICPDWAEGLPLGAAGFVSDYYKKD